MNINTLPMNFKNKFTILYYITILIKCLSCCEMYHVICIKSGHGNAITSQKKSNMHQLISFILTLLLSTILLLNIQAAEVVPFFKCACGGNVTIYALDFASCTGCVKAFCIQEMGEKCSGVDNDSDKD